MTAIPNPEGTSVQHTLSNLVEWIRLGVESIGAIFVVIGVIAALVALARHHRPEDFNIPRLTLARYLVVALEFQLAGDILSTTVAPSWDKIGKLAAIAIIRTLLNYFLMKEIAAEQKVSKAEEL